MKKDPKTMVVVVASNEPEARTEEYESTFKLILKYFPNSVKVPIELGDIIYEGCGFELKTFGDLINAIMHNNGERFRNQLLNMKNNSNTDWYYIIYGKWSDINKYSNINPNAILGAIASISAHYGVRCMILPNKNYAIYTICKIIEKYHDGKSIRPVMHHATTEEMAINSVSCMADKLGENKALDLLKDLGTLKKVVNSDVDTLTKTKGIGKTIAGRMIETINKDFSEQKKDNIIDFDISKDKIDSKESKKPELFIKETITHNNKGGQYLKDLVYKAIMTYVNYKMADAPKSNIVKSLSRGYSEVQITEALRDLEIESRIYMSDQNETDTYYNVY